jgi:response regulator RpfG family c-di-GMP phosphodiesterase
MLPIDREVRVLLVDDQLLVAEMVNLLLEKQLVDGWSLQHTQNPLNALELACEFKPTVMLIDLEMPELNGLQLLEIIRREPSLANLPVIVLSGYEDSDTKALAFERGASDYLVKLPDSVELVARLRHHTSGFIATRQRDEAERRSKRLAGELRERNDQLEDLNKIFKLANEELKDKIVIRDTRLKSIGSVGIEMSEIQDLDVMMQHILTQARYLVGAEAGAILIRDEDDLVVRYAQNDAHANSGRNAADLAGGFRVPISAGSISGKVTMTGRKINERDVYSIPPDAGYTFMASFDERTGYRTRSLFTYPLSTASGEVLGVIQLANPFNKDGDRKGGFDSEDEKLIENFASLASVALERALLTDSMIMRMVAIAETHDPEETGAHVNRVAGYSRVMFEAWALQRGMDRGEMERRRDRLSNAARLHDVGKIGISDSILKKPGKLDLPEYAAMQMHTVIGARFFKGYQTEYDDIAREVALHHHEHWDGTGYPGETPVEDLFHSPPEIPIRHGLKGEEIPIEARIVGLADVYDALSSKRSYKEAWPESKVLQEISDLSGKQFDPELVEIFLDRSDRMRVIRETYKSDID